MSRIIWKGTPLLAPVPAVMVTCADKEKTNVITIAWTGIVCSDPPKTYISLRPERYSYDIIKNSGEFAINLTTRSLAKATDLCGVRSGRDMDKFQLANIHTEAASKVKCPILSESPLCLECRVTDIIKLGSHDMFLADIVATDVDDSILDSVGKLHLERAGLITYAHGDYCSVGQKIGSFGFSVRKKKSKPGKKNKK